MKLSKKIQAILARRIAGFESLAGKHPPGAFTKPGSLNHKKSSPPKRTRRSR